MFQPLNCSENLSYLVGFRLSLVVLDIHARIARPWHAIDAMARSLLPRASEKVIAHLAGVHETDALRVLPHAGQDIFDIGHIVMISIVILSINKESPGSTTRSLHEACRDHVFSINPRYTLAHGDEQAA